MTNYKELRALCDAATDGPWECGTHPANPKLNIIKPVMMWGKVTVLPQCEGSHASMKNKADAEFIAATDPQTVRALIDEVGRVTKQRNILRRWMIKQKCYGASVDTDKLEQAMKGTGHE